MLEQSGSLCKRDVLIVVLWCAVLAISCALAFSNGIAASSYYSAPPEGEGELHKAKYRGKRHSFQQQPASARRPREKPDGTPFIVPQGEEDRYGMVHEIVDLNDLYQVLGVPRNCRPEEMRRAYISRSRVVHPDKFPDYPESTAAFQKLSLAYETLSKPASRKLYDLSGRAEGITTSADGGLGDETLRSVLATVLRELLEGDLAIIRVLISALHLKLSPGAFVELRTAALNDGNPGLNLGEDAIEGLEGVFARIRGMIMSSQKYFRVIRFELIRLYEIQLKLRSLSYFDIRGRLRLTFQLGIIALSIPMAIDQAIGTDPAEPVTTEEDGKEIVRRSLLGPRLAGALALAVSLLERGERVM